MDILSIIWIIIAVIGIAFGLYYIVILPIYYFIKIWLNKKKWGGSFFQVTIVCCCISCVIKDYNIT